MRIRRIAGLLLVSTMFAQASCSGPNGSSAGGDAIRQDVRAEKLDHPFPTRFAVDEFPTDTIWLNTGGPIRLSDLRGKFVLLDFWTYCCINCLHMLPELEALETAYPNELVIIGVHSAKFTTEKDDQNIIDAILRHRIRHPVINDHDHRIWDALGVDSWPTLLLIDPEGNAVWGARGETPFELIDIQLKRGLPYYRQNQLLDATPVHFELAENSLPPLALRYPGKLLADAETNRLFIADTGHHRLVVTDLNGKRVEVIGSGQRGRDDGDYQRAQFNHPQGLALVGSNLYVADTENHLIRKVDLVARRVSTVAGTGAQSRFPFPGATPADPSPPPWIGEAERTPLNSPWDVLAVQGDLYIAMAGAHQVWKLDLAGLQIGPVAGNGLEDIVDGAQLPRAPYQRESSSFAQPSGLASDGRMLFVADSEGGSIRSVPLDSRQAVTTVAGTAHLPANRLFEFGDSDGDGQQARFQHPLGVVCHNGRIYVADTYNNKIRSVDLETGQTRTLSGTGERGKEDLPAQFDEPAGLSLANGKIYVADTNNHLIRLVDPSSGQVSTLSIEGLQPPQSPAALSPASRATEFDSRRAINLPPESVRSREGKLLINVALKLPEGWMLNPAAPMSFDWFVVQDTIAGGAPKQYTTVRVDPPMESFEFEFPKPESAGFDLRLIVTYYYCQTGGEGICRADQVFWQLPIVVDASAPLDHISLTHTVSR